VRTPVLEESCWRVAFSVLSDAPDPDTIETAHRACRLSSATFASPSWKKKSLPVPLRIPCESQLRVETSSFNKVLSDASNAKFEDYSADTIERSAPARQQMIKSNYTLITQTRSYQAALWQSATVTTKHLCHSKQLARFESEDSNANFHHYF